MKFLINWFEIPATDIKRAVTFYNSIFGISLEVIDCGTEKMACFPEIGGVAGAITEMAGLEPSGKGTLITMDGGDDLNDRLALVEQAGGAIIKAKTKIEVEGRGYFALFSDSEGNTIGLYSDK